MKQKPNINLDRKILGEPYPLVQKSLVSFDKWYALLIASQGYRWLLLEVGLPILLALISINWLLIYKITYCS